MGVMTAPGSSNVRGTMAGIAEQREDKSGNRHIDARRSSKKPGRINLKAVAEVLAERGLDPTEAIIDILRPVDEAGEPTQCKLDPDTQARITLELLQYVQPKLKSVEIRAKVAATAFDINDEQAKRIAEEFLKASVAEDDED